jgi:hypothetical protein
VAGLLLEIRQKTSCQVMSEFQKDLKDVFAGTDIQKKL